MSNQQFCSILKNNCSKTELQEVLCFFSKKQKDNTFDLLYYLLEDDIALFLELFGGKKIEVPSKLEIIKKLNELKLFNYIISYADKEDIFEKTSDKFKTEIKRVYSIYRKYYQVFMDMDSKENTLFENLNSFESDSGMESIYNNLYNKIELNDEKIINFFNENKEIYKKLYEIAKNKIIEIQNNKKNREQFENNN